MAVAPLPETAPEAFAGIAPSAKFTRVPSVDRLRGLVMALMVLDHVRDYLMDITVSATDLRVTTPALFFTRWITHFCAPTFALLAGTGAYLARAQGKSRPELTRYLLTRGVWLIVLEQTLAKWLLLFHPAPTFLVASVLWMLGWSMIALAALIWLPTPAIAAIGLAMIAGHNALDGIEPERFGRFALLWKFLHVQSFTPTPVGKVTVIFAIMYPLIPWIGVMAAGYALGAVVVLPPERRRPTLLALGLVLTASFFALRALNLYGDSQPRVVRPEPVLTIISFFNCQKYPPSLLYLLMTLGPSIAMLALLDDATGPVGRWLATLGRVPLFFYLLQWAVAHGLAVALNAALGRPIGWLFDFPPFQGSPESKFGLGTAYAAWVVALLLLTPACIWFGAFKRKHRDWAWLSYF